MGLGLCGGKGRATSSMRVFILSHCCDARNHHGGISSFFGAVYTSCGTRHTIEDSDRQHGAQQNRKKKPAIPWVGLSRCRAVPCHHLSVHCQSVDGTSQNAGPPCNANASLPARGGIIPGSRVASLLLSCIQGLRLSWILCGITAAWRENAFL